MKRFQNWMGIVFSILLSISLIALAVGLPLQKTILRSGFTQQVVQESELYNRLPVVVVDTVYESFKNRPNDAYSPILNLLTREHISILVNETLPEKWLQGQVDGFLASLNEFLNLKTDQLQFDIDLKAVKANIAGDAGVEAFTGILATFPDCSLENVLAITAAILMGNSEGITLCNPPQELLEPLKPFLQQGLALTTAVLPDKESIPIFARQVEALNTTPQRIYLGYSLIYRAGQLLPWVCGMLALLVVLLALPRVKRLLQGLGYPLAAAGLFGGFGYLAGSRVGTELLAGLPARLNLPGYMSGIIDQLVQVGQVTLEIISRQGLIIAGIALAAGLLLILVAVFLKPGK